MKKYIVLFLLILNFPAFAQVDGDFNFTFGLRALNIAQMPKILQQTNIDDYVTSGVTGAMLKFNDNQIAYRLSGYYTYKKNYSFNNACATCETANGSVSDYSFKIGFEKNFNYSVIQPYFAFDIGYRSNSFNGDVRPNSIFSLSQPYMAIASKNSGVITPSLGLKINITPQFSIYSETGIDFLFSYERQETILYNANNTRTFARYNKNEFLLNAITVGLQFHFIGNN